MTPEEYHEMVLDFLDDCDLVRLYAYKETGYEWMVVPKTGENRTMAEQHGLYMRNKNGKDDDGDGLIDEADEKVTNADSGQSPHNFNLARDIVPCDRPGHIWWKAPKELWHKMGKIAEGFGLIWGGNFKTIYDAPHVEAKDWRKAQLAWKQKEIEIA